MNRFAKFVASQSSAAATLPIAHTTDAYSFREILDKHQLKLSPCDVYKQDLLYFFYGRPAYRIHAGVQSVSLPAFNPVCFIVDRDSVDAPQRVMPFDSGAMNAEVFKTAMHPGMDLESFALPGGFGDVDRLVHFFFGSTPAYFMGEPASKLAIPQLEFEAQSYFALISALGQTPGDDRRSCIEIQFNNPIDLTGINVLAVVVPELFLDDITVKHFIKKTLKATPLKYETFHARPAEDVARIVSVVKRFYKRKGWL